MPKPELNSVPSFYHTYIKLVEENDVIAAIQKNAEAAMSLFESIPEEKWGYRYAPDKWSIKEMVQHIIDAERIFCYRSLCFARKEKASLPGFDENLYAHASKADSRKKDQLLNEWKCVRQSSLLLYNSFDEEQLDSVGIANNNPISVHAIGFIIAGHVKHHLNVLNERYLN